MRRDRSWVRWLRDERKGIWLISATAFLVVVTYILLSAVRYRIGFPLDDAWIHQTYARNLAYYGQWAFIPGQISAGSTAPLWSLLLSLGYVFPVDVAYLWTFLLGAIFLALTAITGERLARNLIPEWKPAFPLVGLFLALEWHLVWAAGSGMETVLVTACVLAVFMLLASGRERAIWAGAVAGLTAWVRPDGVTLLGPILFCLILGKAGNREKLKAVTLALSGFLLLFVPYLIFNQALAGSWWPNTFYAKQAEYAVLRETPFFPRLWSIAALPLTGGGVLLLPGFIYQAVNAVIRRAWLTVSVILWWGGYSTLYALLLPVMYQHGRYLIPAMPVYFVLGLVGTVDLMRRFLQHRRWWVLRTAWVTAIAAITIVFLGIGGNAYATDIAVIETEMVTTAHWLAANTRQDDRIAVHDIGAVGFFTGRENLIDLAGLISPEVIPFIRDEGRLAAFMDDQGVDYLVIFPDWYPDLASAGERVFSSGGEVSPSLGHSNMEVYRWTANQQGSR